MFMPPCRRRCTQPIHKRIYWLEPSVGADMFIRRSLPGGVRHHQLVCPPWICLLVLFFSCRVVYCMVRTHAQSLFLFPHYSLMFLITLHMHSWLGVWVGDFSFLVYLILCYHVLGTQSTVVRHCILLKVLEVGLGDGTNVSVFE